MLKIEDRSESDRKIIALTKEEGKQSFIAKGARKSGSRLSALSQPFIRAKVSIACGKKTQFVTQCELLSTHSKIRTDYDRLMSGFAINEVCLALCQFDQVALPEYELLLKTFKCLEEHKEPKIVFLWGLLKFITLEGICPHWISQEKEELIFPEKVLFSLRAGGMILPEEKITYSDCELVPISVLITLDKLNKLSIPPSYVKDIDSILIFITHISQKIFHKKNFIMSSLLQ